MTTPTPNLGMTTWNSTTDASAVTFSVFRAGEAGISPTSNINILDSYAGLTSASLSDLKNRSVYVVPAIYVSPNYYESNSVTGFTSYNNGQLIDLSLDTTSASSTMVNINALGAKTLKKIDSSGSTVDVTTGDIEKNKDYLFRYASSYWLWIGGGGGTGGIASISGSGIMSDTTGSVVKHNVSGVTSASYNRVLTDQYGHITSGSVSLASTTGFGDVEFATVQETTDIEDETRAITAHGLAYSLYGKKIINISAIDPFTTLSIGDGKAMWTVPAELDYYTLVNAHAAIYTVSSASTPTFQIHNVTDGVDILSTPITIDVSEYNSYTAAVQPVISASYRGLTVGDRIRFDCDVSGSGTKGMDIMLTCQLL
jgi:hypothetical protein